MGPARLQQKPNPMVLIIKPRLGFAATFSKTSNTPAQGRSTILKAREECRARSYRRI
jgi:hypothetical protein